MKNRSIYFALLFLLVCSQVMTSCKKNTSGATAWEYNTPENGGFFKMKYREQETGPGLVLVEGGTFTMGSVEEDLKFAWDNIARRVTVSSFYMDETEVTNQYWLDYLTWLKLVYGDEYPELINRALPDTLVWREKMEFNEPFVDYYLRHPAYQEYPVVGVNWLQANDYCQWRTDRVNEFILVREKILKWNTAAQTADEHFTTQTYYAGQYQGEQKSPGLKDVNAKNEDGKGFRRVRLEDGMMLPNYRLPTEAEWEYAALGLIGNSFQELVTDRRSYPWDGHFVRNDGTDGSYFGSIRANFVRGNGDMMGVAGALNDNAEISAPVYAYPPNDYGLYNMAGNVSEWVLDVYRPLSPEDKSDFRPFRGNVYQTKVLNNDGTIADKYDKNFYDVAGVDSFLTKYERQAILEEHLTPQDQQLLTSLRTKIEDAKVKNKERKYDEAQEKMGEIMEEVTSSEAVIAPDLRDAIADYITNTSGHQRMRNVNVEENIDRRNYQRADNIDYLDGDYQSSIYAKENQVEMEKDENRMYDWGRTTLVNNRSRVIKGGSWRDRAYYTIPGTRRYLDERRSLSTLGFRCAMTRVGSPTGIGSRGEEDE
jgi:gliding motility-associated lipoprotein GldJ